MPGKLLVILGAGASFDVAFGNVEAAENWQPPLTDDLFAPRFEGILARYPSALSLSATIQARVSKGSQLESVLTELSKMSDSDVALRVREIPLYLRELLGMVSEPGTYVRDPGCFSVLIDHLLEREIETLFLTLNYDTLLERAIRASYVRTGIIQSMTDYVSDGRNWQLVKLHGSVDWGWSVGTQAPGLSHDDYLRRVRDLSRVDTSGPPDYLGSYEATVSQGFLQYPALALPSDEKYGFVCPSEHIEAAERFLDKKPHILVIGASGHDHDLLDLLARYPISGTTNALAVIGAEDAEEAQRLFSSRLAPALPPRVYTSGFKPWLEARGSVDFFDYVSGRSLAWLADEPKPRRRAPRHQLG